MPSLQPVALHLPDTSHPGEGLPPKTGDIRRAEEEMTKVRPFLSSPCEPLRPNTGAVPVNQSLKVEELSDQNDEDIPMMVPEEVGEGDRTPSPDQVSPMDEYEGAGSRTPGPKGK